MPDQIAKTNIGVRKNIFENGILPASFKILDLPARSKQLNA